MDKSSVGIRRALTSDVEALEIVRAASGMAPGPKSMADHLLEPGTFTYLAERDEPFGCVTVGVCDLALAEGEVLEWFLLPRYRKRSLGLRLLVHGLSVLKRRMCESALIWIPDGSERPEQVLRRQGFEPSDVIRETNVGGTTITEKGWVRDLSELF